MSSFGKSARICESISDRFVRTYTSKTMKRPVAFSQAMKLTWPNDFPLTTTWFPVTSTASAISGFETEKRSIGLSKVITLDWPTSTLTGIASFVPVEKEAFVVCSCAKSGTAQSRIVTRTTIEMRMERDCMIIFSLTDWGQVIHKTERTSRKSSSLHDPKVFQLRAFLGPRLTQWSSGGKVSRQVSL